MTSKQRVVTLAGLVASEAEREMAEQDAWYVFGVDKVINKLEAQEQVFAQSHHARRLADTVAKS